MQVPKEEKRENQTKQKKHTKKGAGKQAKQRRKRSPAPRTSVEQHALVRGRRRAADAEQRVRARRPLLDERQDGFERGREQLLETAAEHVRAHADAARRLRVQLVEQRAARVDEADADAHVRAHLARRQPQRRVRRAQQRARVPLARARVVGVGDAQPLPRAEHEAAQRRQLRVREDERVDAHAHRLD